MLQDHSGGADYAGTMQDPESDAATRAARAARLLERANSLIARAQRLIAEADALFPEDECSDGSSSSPDPEAGDGHADV
jgi:hypothetical protein